MSKKILTGTKNYSTEKLRKIGHQMTIYISGSNSKQCRWTYKLRKCRKHFGIRTKNWLTVFKLPFDKLLLFIYLWCENKTSINFCEHWIYHQAVWSIFQAICVRFALTKFSKIEKKMWKLTNHYLPEEKTGEASSKFNLGSLWYLSRQKKTFHNSCAWQVGLNHNDCHRNLRWTSYVINTDCWKSYSILDDTDFFTSYYKSSL